MALYNVIKQTSTGCMYALGGSAMRGADGALNEVLVEADVEAVDEEAAIIAAAATAGLTLTGDPTDGLHSVPVKTYTE